MKFDRRLTDEIYTSDTVRLGKNAFQAMQETIYHNGGVGTITGYYDAELSILSVSDLLLHNLNHSYASLMEQTKGSLKNLFYKRDATFLDNARFRQIKGEGEGRILTADGSPVYVRLYKEDAVDTDGTPIWIMSVQMNWAYENLALVNESIHSALWYFECNENGEIVHVNWSHAFRQILGYHDILDFPNKLDSWSNLLHPEDYDRVMQLLLEAIADKTNATKYNVEYRLKMQDGQYHWFRASAEGIRRLDGSANRIAGIISNIDAEKRSRMQAQRAAAFHRAFTSANLCEYYVNLEKNTFDTFKVEPSLMTAFEQNHTWDGLVRFFVDNYVVEEDKQSVTDFYNRAYITEKLKGLETELRQECRIVLNGEERWVSNVVMRGEIEDSEYAMIFLRDITESKAETARRMQMASDNASMDLLIKSMVRLLDRFVVCDLENDRYRFYNLQGEMIYAPIGTYHDFVAGNDHCGQLQRQHQVISPSGGWQRPPDSDKSFRRGCPLPCGSFCQNQAHFQRTRGIIRRKIGEINGENRTSRRKCFMEKQRVQTPDESTPYAIEMLHITKRFPGIIANDDITLQLRHGEIHALLGENGAGKSTLMSVLFGLYQPEKGEIRKDGETVSIRNPNDATALGIGMVHQHFKLVECFTVLDNIILGVEPTKMGFLQKKEARQKVLALSERYGLHVDPDAKVEDITVGMPSTIW